MVPTGASSYWLNSTMFLTALVTCCCAGNTATLSNTATTKSDTPKRSPIGSALSSTTENALLDGGETTLEPGDGGITSPLCVDIADPIGISTRGPSWFLPREMSRPLQPLQLTTWLRTHEVDEDQELGTVCYEVGKVGVFLQDGILCAQYDDPLRKGDGRSLFVGHIYIADQRKVREIFRGPVGAGPMDSPNCCGLAFYVKLNPIASADGRTLSLVEDSTYPCANEKKRFEPIADMPPAWIRQQSKLEHMACDSIGTYVWHNGRYVRSRQGMKPSKSSGP